MPAKKPAKPVAKALVPQKKKPVSKTPVRNTPLPKVAKKAVAAKPLAISQDMIAKRAFEIHMGGTGGGQDDNWHRAERELRSGL